MGWEKFHKLPFPARVNTAAAINTYEKCKKHIYFRFDFMRFKWFHSIYHFDCKFNRIFWRKLWLNLSIISCCTVVRLRVSYAVVNLGLEGWTTSTVPNTWYWAHFLTVRPTAPKYAPCLSLNMSKIWNSVCIFLTFSVHSPSLPLTFLPFSWNLHTYTIMRPILIFLQAKSQMQR